MDELLKKIDLIIVELNKVYGEKYPNKGHLDRRVVDVALENTKKIQIFTISENADVEPDVIFTIEKKHEHIIVNVPFLNKQEVVAFDDNFYEDFCQKSVEIICSNDFERRLNLFHQTNYVRRG